MRQRRQWGFLLAGSVSLAANQWLMLWLLARSAPSETVGHYGLAVAWVVPAFGLAGLQLRALLATEKEFPQLLPVYLRLRAAAIGLALLSILPLLWLDPFWAGSGFLLGAMALGRVSELTSDFADGVKHRQRSYLALGLSQCCRSAAAFATFAMVWLHTENLAMALLASAVAALLSAWMLDWPWLRCALQAVPREALIRHLATHRKVLGYALPLAAVQFLNLAVVHLPRVLLGRFTSLEEVAAFTCLTSVLAVAGLIASAYSATLAPDFAEAFSRGHRTPAGFRLLRLACMRVAMVAIPGALAIWPFGASLLRWVYSPHLTFPPSAVACTLGFAALWSVATVYGTAATANRKITLQLWAFGGAVAVCAGAGLALIPRYGIVGASASLLLAAVTLLAVYGYAYREVWIPSTAAVAGGGGNAISATASLTAVSE